MAIDTIQQYWDPNLKEWIEIHPITKASNVIDKDGKNMDTVHDELKDLYEQVQSLTESGIPKLVRYVYTIHPTTEGQTTFEIPLDHFTTVTDSEEIYQNTTLLDPNEDYTISGRTVELKKGVSKDNTRWTVFVYKNMPVGPDGAINASVLLNKSIHFEKLDENTQNLINEKAKQSDLDNHIANYNNHVSSFNSHISSFNSHVSDYVKHPAFAVASGSANNYSVSIPNATSYVNGMGVVVAINTNATGACTLNVNGLGAVPIKKANGNAVNNLKANGVYTVRYMNGNFILQGEGGEYGNVTPDKVLSGVTFGTENGLATGTMPNRGSIGTVTPGTADKNYGSGYYNAFTVKGDPNLIASNIIQGKSIFGVNGTASFSSIEPWFKNVWINTGINMNESKNSIGSAGTDKAAISVAGQKSGGNPTRVVELFNNTVWSTAESIPSGGRGTRATGSQNAVVALGGTYVGAHQDDDTFLNSIYESSYKFNGTSWTQTGNPIQKGYNFGIAGTQNAAIVYGGMRYDPGYTVPRAVRSTELFNGTSWSLSSATTKYQTYMQGYTGVQNDCLSVAGYLPGSNSYGWSERFNGTAWVEISALLTKYTNTGCVGSSNAALLYGGADVAGNLKNFMQHTYRFNGSSWTNIGPSMNEQRHGHGATGSVTAAICFAGSPDNEMSSTYGMRSTEKFFG